MATCRSSRWPGRCLSRIPSFRIDSGSVGAEETELALSYLHTEGLAFADLVRRVDRDDDRVPLRHPDIEIDVPADSLPEFDDPGQLPRAAVGTDEHVLGAHPQHDLAVGCSRQGVRRQIEREGSLEAATTVRGDDPALEQVHRAGTD